MAKKHGYSEASRDKLQSLTPENLATIRSVYVQQVLCSPFKKITSLSSIYIYMPLFQNLSLLQDKCLRH